MKKHVQCLLLLAALLLPWATQAQSYTLANYGFTTGVDASKWVSMTGSTQILTPSGSDGLASSVQTIGFSFPFGGSNYTQYSVNTDGNLRLGSTVTGTTNYTTPFSSSLANQNNPKINAFGCDGYGVSGSHYVKKLLIGDTLLVVEFCTGTYSSTTREILYKWQVHLYSNGNIDIVFPDASALPTVAPAVAHQCGLCASASDGWVISLNTNTAEHFTNGSTTTNASGTWFDANRYYSFVHPNNISCAAPTSLAVNNITVDGATFTWTAGGTETEWEVTVDGNSQFVYTNTYTATGLDGNTPYVVSVRAICGAGDTSFATSASFRTACVAISSMPYSNDFESEPNYSSTPYADAFPNCWHRINDATGTNNYYPYLYASSTYAHSGGVGMYWYQSTTSGYASNEYAVLPPVDDNIYNISDLTLSFYAKTTSTSYHPQPIVGVMTDPTNASTFTPVYTFTATEITTAWQLFVIPLSSYTGAGNYIAIKWPNPSATSYMAIDDIYLTDEWCDVPLNVTASATTDEVTVSWNTNGGSSFTIIFGEDTVTNVYDSSYTFYGLTPNTAYNYSVATECDSSVSSYIGGSIRTLCLSLDSLPYTYGFEDLPTGSTTVRPVIPCWHHINNGTQYFGYPYPSSSYSRTGSRSLYWYASTTAGTYSDYQLAVLPAVDTDIYPINTLMLEFWARPSSTSYSPVFQVGVMTDPTDNSTFQLVETVNVQNVTTFQQFEVPFSDFTGYGQFIAVRVVRPTSAWYAYTDDFTIKELPACPHVASVTPTNITQDSIAISWEPVGSEYSWVVTNGTDSYEVYDTTFVFEYLTANTPYTIGVAPLCDNGDTGEYVYIQVRTACSYLTTLPYTENFDGVTGSTSTSMATNNLPSCWDNWNVGTSTSYSGYPIVYNSSSYAHSGSQAMRFYTYITSGTYSDQIALMPITDSLIYPLQNLRVSFWMRSNTTSYNSWIVVGVMSDPDNASTFVPVETIYTNSSTTYAQHTVSFVGYNGPHGCVAFKAPQPTSGYNYLYIDDVILEELPSCPSVTSIHAQTTAGAARLTWTYDASIGTPIGYNIAYRYADDSTATPITTTTTDPELVLTGLDADTAYWVSVEALCNDGTSNPYATTFNTQALPCLEWDTTGGPAAGPADTIVLGTPGTSTSAVMPLNQSYNYSYCQHLFLASHIPHTGPVTFSGIGFDYAYTQPMTHATNCSIYLANTTRADMMGTDSTFVPYSQLQLVYVGPLNCTASGWNYFQFNQGTFTYDGVSNMVVAIVDNSGSSDGTSYVFRYETVSGTAMSHRVYGSTPYGPTQMDAARAGQSYWRSNTRMLTGGGGDCITLASCFAPAVTFEQDSLGDYQLSWLPGYQESDWDVDYRPADSNGWINVATGTSSMDYTFLNSDLQPNTQYQFRVTANCYDTLMSTTVVYTTPCSFFTVPFSESFDTWSSTAADPLPNCWDKHTNYTTNYPYASTSYHHSGTKAMYMYSTNTSYSYMVLPLFNIPADSTELTFWLYKTNTSYAHNLLVGVMTDPTDITTFTQVADVAPSAVSTWEMFEVSLQSYTGTGRYIAIMSPDNVYSYPYLDDLTVNRIAACPRVRGVLSRNITQTDATIAWTPTSADEYEVQYGPAGFTLGTGTIVNNIYEDSVVLMSLNSGTLYDVYVRGLCMGDSSNWSFVYQFQTECMFATLPIIENFDAITGSTSTSSMPNILPPCWDYYNDGTRANYQGCPYVYSNTTYAHSGSNCIRFYTYNSSGDSNQYLILPVIDSNDYAISDLQLSFWLRGNSTSSNYFNNVIVGVMTDPNNEYSFIPYDTILSSTTTYTYFEVNLNRYTGPHGRVTLLFPKPASSSQYEYGYLDDLMLGPIPNCLSVDNLTATYVTADTVVLEWNAGGSEYEWELSYGSYSVTVYDSTYTASGLTPNTEYTFSVRAICGTGDTSYPVSYTLHTGCVPFAIPFTESFDSWSSTAADPLPNCWEKHTNYSTNYPYASTSYHHTGTKALYMYSTNTTYSYMVLPQFDLPVDSTMVSFWLYKTNTSYAHKLQVGVMTNPADVSTFVQVAEVAPTLSSAWEEFEVPLSSYHGTGTRIAIMSPNNEYSYPYLDDLTVTRISNCPRVLDLRVASVLLDSATIAWTDGSNQAWYVEYDTVDFTPGTNHNLTYVTDTFCVLSGLDSGTTYHVYVYPDCGTEIADRHITFTTLAAAPARVPYSCNFEAAGVNGWDFIQSGQNNYWVVGNNVNHGGSRSMYVTDNGTTNNYSGAASYSFATRTFYLPAGGYVVSYDWKANGESSFDFLRAALVPAGINFVAGEYNGFDNGVAPSGTLPAGGIALDGGGRLNLQTSWQTETNEIVITTPGTYKLVFMWRNDPSVYNNPPAAIDNVSITSNNCPIVANLAATAVATTSITVDWTDVAGATSWEVEYSGNGTTNRNIVTAHPTTITGLTPATAYSIRVRPICSATDTGAWCDAYNAFTGCDLIVPPYVQNFDAVPNAAYNASGVLPPCWDGYSNGTTAAYMPHVTDGGTYSYTLGGNSLTLTSGSSTYGDVKYVRLPEFATPVNTLTMSYWFCTESSTNGTLTVGYMTDTNFTTDFVPVVSHAASSASVHNGNGVQPAGYGIYDTVSFDSVPANARYIAFKWVYASSYYSCCIDNIEVTSSGAVCTAPTITSTTGDYQSQTVTWSGNGTAYEIAMKPVSATTWPAETAVTTNSYTFTGLLPATPYQFRVRQDCTADSIGYSTWTEGSFVTDSLPCLAPDTFGVIGTTNATATFAWLPAGNETAWEIHVFNATFDSLYTVTGIPATVGGFTAGVTYNATIRALCGDASNIEGEWGDTVQFTAATCESVTGLTSSNVTFNSVTLSWTAVTGAVGYRVVCTDGQDYDTVTVTTNTHTFTGLYDETSYTFYVQTVCGTGWYSENWAQLTVTTAPATGTTYYVTANANNAAYGSVTGGGTYAANATATLTATPNTGYSFTRWNDNVTTNPRSIVVTSDTTFTAIFTVNQYTVTVVNANPTMGAVSGTGTYAYNTTATITATPNNGYHFTGWNDGDTNTTRTITVTSDTIFTAGFAPNQYTVTAVPSDASMGSVTGSGTYNFGDTATLTATPNTGYGFRGWSDGNTSNPRSLIVTGDISLTANFSNDTSAITEYTVTLTVNDPAMGTLSTTGGTYAEGSTLVVTATANAGYHFVNWSDDNTDNPRTFIVNSDITLQANFAQDIDSTAVLNIVVEGNGYVTVNGTETSIFRGRLGDVVTLVAAPYEGAAFRGWSDGNTDATRSYTLTENNATLTATFGSVGIDAVATASCTLYPNPAKGATTVSVTGISGKVHIAVLDLSGREVLGREFSILNSQFSISLDIEGLAEGAYFVRITSENNVPMVKRLIVR